MDNVTHSLIGIAAAETWGAGRAKSLRVPLWIASAVANNLPDLDVLFTSGRGKLDYLLHHRGYTHTLLLAPVQGVLWLACLRLLWWKREGIPWRAVSALCVLGPFLHLLADAWNSYGVHPYWPWNNEWVYGDLTFIVEPWIWLLLLPVVWRRAASLPGRGIALLLFALILGLGWWHAFVPAGVALAFTVVGLTWLAAQRFLANDRLRIGVALAGIAAFFALSGLAGATLRARYALPGEETALLPTPGNPFCFTVLRAGFTGEEYHAAAFTAVPWPALNDPRQCPAFFHGGHSAAFTPVPATQPGEIALGEFRGTRAELLRLARSCRARAFLRFARIPFWGRVAGREVLGDLRFDQSRAFSFAEVAVGETDDACPEVAAPWEGPFFRAAIDQ